jgi:hypothetical protein
MEILFGLIYSLVAFIIIVVAFIALGEQNASMIFLPVFLVWLFSPRFREAIVDTSRRLTPGHAWRVYMEEIRKIRPEEKHWGMD